MLLISVLVVRPSNPGIGFLYIPLYGDYTAAQPQLYDGSDWINVTCMVYNGDTTVNVLGYRFSPVGASPDIDMSAKPERPSKPGDDSDICNHNWEEVDRTDATCSLPGFVEYTCSKCKESKTEVLAKLSHSWEVKQSVQTTYDDDGNILTQGFTIYRCTVCGEEYKDTDGSGPPMASTPGTSGGSTSGGSDDDGFWSKIGNAIGTVLGSLLDLIGSFLSSILDGIIDLCTKTIESLKSLIDLFGSFGDALGILWTWLPEEVMLVLIAGVTVFVFLSVLKLFLK